MKRFCEINGLPEVKELKPDMDFRNPQYRREVFMRFYEFHSEYLAHAGGVYYFIPYLAKYFNWSIEEQLWFASINALTQYPMTSLAIFQQIQPPPFSESQYAAFNYWFNENWKGLPFDTDRKYQKRLCPAAIKNLNCLVKEKYGSLQKLYSGNFKELWARARTELYSLGRLGAWSGLEYIKIVGDNKFEFDDLMLEDKQGSKSHRNGLCKVLGWDQYDWHEKTNPDFNGDYSKKMINWLKEEAETLLQEAKKRFAGKWFESIIGYQTLETTLCCYKSWHRENRRYPNVYNDMAYGRLIETAIKNPDLDLKPFYEARKYYLPEHLLIECKPKHPQYGTWRLSKKHQNYYRLTGKIHTMGYKWDCFDKEI